MWLFSIYPQWNKNFEFPFERDRKKNFFVRIDLEILFEQELKWFRSLLPKIE